MAQEYPGELEFVFAAKDQSEPLLAEVRETVAAHGGGHHFKWIYPVETQDLNPRTAKIAAAFQKSKNAMDFLDLRGHGL